MSQAAAEKAAWELSKELNMSMITILPSMTLGPVASCRGGFSVNSGVVSTPVACPWLCPTAFI